jgi:hypothetical protein
MANFAQRQIPRLFSPHHRQLGSPSQVNRRTNCRKIRISAAVPGVPACHIGDNFANPASFNAPCNNLVFLFFLMAIS